MTKPVRTKAKRKISARALASESPYKQAWFGEVPAEAGRHMMHKKFLSKECSREVTVTTQAPCITKVQNPEATATTLPAHHKDSASGAASTGGTAALAAAR